MKPPRFLVFQHIGVEHPGVFRGHMRAAGIEWDTVELDEGDAVPTLDGYGALIVMGGPMDVWQEDRHPWLVTEKQAIREAVSGRGIPYLGVCLGHQLLADALGGRVGPMQRAEVGVLDVELTPEGRADPLFGGLPARIPTVQWHGAEVSVPPTGATVLARSPVCAVQAMRVGHSAWGMQFHVEITGTTVDEWGAIPEYACALENTLGNGALGRFREAAAARAAALNTAAERVFSGFLGVAVSR